jgi:hypothetical protein
MDVMRLLALMCGVLLFPLIASADDTLQPKYPPSWDCSTVPAGSQRQGCNRSQLDPPMGAIPDTQRTQPQFILPRPQQRTLPTGAPPTIPRLPGTINNSN